MALMKIEVFWDLTACRLAVTAVAGSLFFSFSGYFKKSANTNLRSVIYKRQLQSAPLSSTNMA